MSTTISRAWLVLWTTLTWTRCSGATGAGGNTANYASEVLELTGERIGKVESFLRQLLDEGNDPARIVVEAAKKRGVDVFLFFSHKRLPRQY